MGRAFVALRTAAAAVAFAAQSAAGERPAVPVAIVGASSDRGGSASPLARWPRAAGVVVPAGLAPLGERLALFGPDGVERGGRVTAWSLDESGAPSLVRVLLGELDGDARQLELRSTRAAAPPSPLRATRDARGALQWSVAGERGGHGWRSGTWRAAEGDAAIELDLLRIAATIGATTTRLGSLGAPLVVGPDGGGVELTAGWRTLREDESDDGEWRLRGGVTVELSSSGRFAQLELAFTATRDVEVARLTLPGHVEGHVAPRETAAAVVPAAAIAVGEGRRRVELVPLVEGARAARPVTLAADGSFALPLTDEPLPLRAGQTLRRTLLLARGESVGTVAARSFVAAVDVGAAPLDEATRSWLAPWRRLLAEWIARPCRACDRGCVREAWGEWSNGEFDLGGSLLWLGALERDPAWLECGRVVARHTLDFDRAVVAPAGLPSGLFFQHGDAHASGKVEAGHQWVGGTLRLAQLEGDVAAFEAARRLGEALDEWRGVSDAFEGPQRRLAWPLRVATELHAALRDVPSPRLAKAMVEALRERQSPSGWLDGERAVARGQRCVWLNTWVALGVTVDALVRAQRRWPQLRAFDAAHALARFVAAESAEESQFPEALLVDPESDQVVAREGHVGGGDAALAAAGLEWLARVDGRRDLAARAAELRAKARHDLATPKEGDLVGLAKALLALRFELELPTLTAGAPSAQSSSSPSSLRTGRPRAER